MRDSDTNYGGSSKVCMSMRQILWKFRPVPGNGGAAYSMPGLSVQLPNWKMVGLGVKVFPIGGFQ